MRKIKRMKKIKRWHDFYWFEEPSMPAFFPPTLISIHFIIFVAVIHFNHLDFSHLLLLLLRMLLRHFISRVFTAQKRFGQRSLNSFPSFVYATSASLSLPHPVENAQPPQMAKMCTTRMLNEFIVFELSEHFHNAEMK